MTPDEAREQLMAWRANDEKRDAIVRAAAAAGLGKREIHLLSGISRQTVYTILERAMATRNDIIALRDEAASAGDLEQVAICDRALWGNSGDPQAAWEECERVIAAAHNMAAGDEG